MLNIKWRKDGDDTYMVVNGKETDNLVCHWSGIYSAYLNNKEIGMADTLKEAKEMILLAGGYLG